MSPSAAFESSDWIPSVSVLRLLAVAEAEPIAMFLKVGSKGWVKGTSIEALFPDLPWMDQMGLTALLTMAVIIVISIKQNKGAEDSKAINLPKSIFNTSPIFNIGAFATFIILTVIYSLFW